jgi:hypothetical protein
MRIDGKCHCGAISYKADVNPDDVVICHCTDCQTFSGAPYRASVAVLLNKLQLDGAPKEYRKFADSGRQVTTTFCAECGTALYSQGSGRDFVFLRIGSITQRAELTPSKQGFCRSAAQWAMDIRDIAVIAPHPLVERSATT